MNSLTWLHLSDWHQKGRDFDRRVVRDALIKDLKDREQIAPTLGKVDFVVFSGDVAFYGKEEEFQAARRELFDPVLNAVAVAPERLFMVPGNHDLDQGHVKKFLPSGLQQPLREASQVQEWLEDPKGRACALGSFEAYSAFVSGFTRQDPAAYANVWSEFIGQKTVGILCLNSAWMCGRNPGQDGQTSDRGFLTLGEPQIHEGLAKIEKADVRLVILHHPFEWLAPFDRNQVETRLKQACHFILTGHEHRPGLRLETDLVSQCVVIPGGASYHRPPTPGRRFANAYNFVQLDFDTGQGTIFLRRWIDQHSKWMADHESHCDGRFNFTLPKELGAPGPTPPPPGQAAPPPPGNTPETPAIAAYRERLRGATSKLDLIRLGHGVPIQLPIDQAFVPLNVAPIQSLGEGRPGRVHSGSREALERCEASVVLGDIFKWAARFAGRGVLLLGDPGAGKTTGARQFCWRVLTEPDPARNLGLPAGIVPVFLRLRNLTPHQRGLKDFITDGVSSSILPAEQAQPCPDLLARHGVLWIFDGLDEVVSEEARVRVCGWIKEAIEQRTGDYFLVTSRHQGYQGPVELGPAFCQFQVRPLDAAQSGEFVARWYRAVFQRLHPDDPEHPVKAAAEADALAEVLGQPEYKVGRLRQLPSNPLLLTILCLMHHQDRNLPRRRADLYARCVRVLVEHWRKDVWKAQAISGYDPEAAEGVLGAVAWWLHGEEGRITQTVARLGGEAGKALADLAPGAGLGRDGEAFIKRMRDESGVLADWPGGQCGFLHLGFQEYLAGLHAAREGKAADLAGQAGKSWWREVILVAAAIGSREFSHRLSAEFIRTGAVLREGALVDQCLEEARYAVLEPLIEALRAGNPSAELELGLLLRLKPFSPQGLLEECRQRTDSSSPEVASLAREILARSGVAVARPKIEAAGTPLELVVDPGTSLAFIRLPQGEFSMGQAEGGVDRERPVHRVRLTRPFLMGKYPVTNAEYGRFLQANPRLEPPGYWTDSRFN